MFYFNYWQNNNNYTYLASTYFENISADSISSNSKYAIPRDLPLTLYSWKVISLATNLFNTPAFKETWRKSSSVVHYNNIKSIICENFWIKLIKLLIFNFNKFYSEYIFFLNES